MSKLQSLSSQLVAKSWCHTNVQVMNYSFMWTIKNFSYCREQTGEYLKSSMFPTGSKEKLKWCLRMFPKGHEKCEGFVSVYLELVSCNEPSVHVTSKFSVLNAKQEEKHVLEFTNAEKLVEGEVLGYKEFLSHEVLKNEANTLLNEDRLTLYCEVSAVVDTISISGRNSAAIYSHSPEHQLSNDFSDLFKSMRLSDVVLVSDSGREFAAHKAVLAARSPVFAAMFEHHMKEKKENTVKITNMDDQVLKALLCCIYSGKAADIMNMPEDLLAAADRYALDGIKRMCEEHLSSNLSTGGAAEVLILADLYKADHLKGNVLDFIHMEVAEVMKTSGWKSLIQAHPQLVTEVFQAPDTNKLSFS